MIINPSNLNSLFVGFKAAFNSGLGSVPSYHRQVAMIVPSATAEEQYGWLGQFPGVREWIGARQIKNLMAHGYTLKNRSFESTISVPRTSIEDDRIGVFKAPMEELGRAAGNHPDQLVFGLLKSGFDEPCYDGQNFFDADHPVPSGVDAAVSVSNIQDGEGEPWFLLDTSHSMKPIIYQERIPYALTALNQEGDPNVFFEDEYIYGTRGRSNAGFGLWQLAFASKAELTPANYDAARAAMASFNGDEGRPLNIRPDTIVVPPSLEGAALRLINNGSRVEIVNETPVSIQNEWAGTAKLIVTPWLG
ncbi:Mu-like prophage major head subunit gpT family protein [Methyloceanibacter sp.]|uniref:Mu-like prophage major head subunit gpT family protein n=1 Tax=Methyloceanibacter sp. TaxID=1965321 RepID=UPI002CB7986A|nr:Mu-like prophage major head subunit gpT family protein [Methyloceanibacter sp.]HML92212.1 Mu-like prophage major head subunit gpT family protein [Methyloceanibacter sp.]